ncbi:hypothetical protein [Natronomonas sp.]|uniref:hypothetical protein n=1 Tax=Natronomonas sp. TaxID=2184060 RepID=UPI003976B492
MTRRLGGVHADISSAGHLRLVALGSVVFLAVIFGGSSALAAVGPVAIDATL